MFKKRGIVLNIFIYTAFLITLVIIISFGILYMVLPDYYTYSKNKVLRANADALAETIINAGTEKELNYTIMEFSLLNNADVIAYDENDLLLVEMSSPFNLMKLNSQNYLFSIEKISEISEDVPIVKNKTLFVNRKSDMAIHLKKEIGNLGIKYIEIIGTMQPINEAKNVIISLMPFLLIVNIFIALIAAYFYSRRITKPILKLSDTARKMQNLTPNIISGIRTKDEIGELSENLDILYQKLCSNIKNLQDEMDKVSELEKSKTDFMRAASHELKTPISALNGIVEGMIDNVGKYKDKNRYLRESKKLIDSLTKLLYEILNASKLDTTENIIKSEPVKISELIKDALEKNRLFIEEKKLDINFEKTDIIIQSDKKILDNTISNLISNAVKYTENNGAVTVSVTDEGECYCLSLENQCEPIPEKELRKLFEPFYTRNYSRSRNKSGTGLGLYIVKRNLESLQLPYKLENTKSGVKFNIYFEKTVR